MKNYKVLFLLGFILVIAGLVLGAVLHKDFIESKISSFSAQKTALTVEEKKIIDSTKPFNIDIIYPQIAGQDAFNKMVQDAIDKELADFKKNSLENDAAVKKIDPVSYEKYPRTYDLKIGFTKGEIDENIISIIVDVYNFEGGAHGAHYFLPENYNVKDKKEIKLADLYAGQSDYLQKISDYCIKNLTDQITKAGETGALDSFETDWIKQGAGPTAENFSVFLINKNSTTFYFPEYQVAPYAFGDFKVIFPK